VAQLIARSAPPGSTIGVVTPGSPAETRAEVERGVAWWESKGYRIKLMPEALAQDDWHGGSPEVRAADLQEAFADPEVDVVQTMRGGYGSAQVVPLLDFDAIAKTPKAFFGLSDITAMHAALLARAGMVTFYGPSLTMFGSPSPSEFTTERFLNVLGVPVLYDLPLGHGATLPLGVQATVDADAKTLTIDEPALLSD
jgi:muramoyltetrapeptide carboxypeptidase